MVGILVWHCERCDGRFANQRELHLHKRDSPSHFECDNCEFDGFSRAELLIHFRKTGCLHVCEGCAGGTGAGWVKDRPAYWKHVADEHVCIDCGRHFSSESNLWHHSLTHRTAKIKCLVCDRKFTTYGGMIIHLEAGTCPSGIDALDLNKSASMCYQWKKWINKVYRSELGQHARVEGGAFPFKCPTCEAPLPKLSSLFMHVASPSCSERLNSNTMKKLKRWLWKRHHTGYHRNDQLTGLCRQFNAQNLSWAEA